MFVRCTLAVVLLSTCGCDRIPFVSSESDDSATEESAADPSEAAEVSEASYRQRIGQLLENVMPTLEETRELVDQHADLPDDSAIPFKLDKRSNSAAINELLDEAIVALSVSEVSDFRTRIRDANQSIVDSQKKIADYRRKRLSATPAKDQSRLDRVNPFELSKEAIDELIEDEESSIKARRDELKNLKITFAEELAKIGVEVDEQGVEALLSSVSGDDIITMAVVFDNIKQLTTQLQTLTEESDEALETSKRYYGMYVVMVHVMDRIQKTFIRDVDEKHIPKLNEFIAKADENIRQAKKLIEVDGGDPKVLQGNIKSNDVTRKTAALYINYLKQNAKLIAQENRLAEKNLATAINTYDTVKLSSDVAALMRSGRQEFETLMRLRVPSLREFGNNEIRKEFQRMTGRLRSDT
ncbi:MAG: hypothetical protein AAF802_05715 [Planctomycetota bacterium]